MITIEKKPHGFYVTLSGTITAEEIREYEAQVNRQWLVTDGPRSSILDMRELVIPRGNEMSMFADFFHRSRESGLQRLAVVVKSPVLKARAIQLAFEVDGTEMIRFFDASRTPDWLEQCNDWVMHALDPIDLHIEDTGKIRTS